MVDGFSANEMRIKGYSGIGAEGVSIMVLGLGPAVVGKSARVGLGAETGLTTGKITFAPC